MLDRSGYRRTALAARRRGRSAVSSTLVPFGDATAGDGHVWFRTSGTSVTRPDQARRPADPHVEATLRNHYAATRRLRRASIVVDRTAGQPRATVRLASAQSIPQWPREPEPAPLPPPRLPQRPLRRRARRRLPAAIVPKRRATGCLPPAARPRPAPRPCRLSSHTRTGGLPQPQQPAAPYSYRSTVMSSRRSPIPAAAAAAGSDGRPGCDLRPQDRDRARGQSDDHRSAARSGSRLRAPPAERPNRSLIDRSVGPTPRSRLVGPHRARSSRLHDRGRRSGRRSGERAANGSNWARTRSASSIPAVRASARPAIHR